MKYNFPVLEMLFCLKITQRGGYINRVAETRLYFKILVSLQQRERALSVLSAEERETLLCYKREIYRLLLIKTAVLYDIKLFGWQCLCYN